MAPKKKGKDEEQRNPLDIMIDSTAEQIKHCEVQTVHFKEALTDLAVHTVKLKQFEAELGPKETEHKNITQAFTRSVDSAAIIKIKLRANEDDTRPMSRLTNYSAGSGGGYGHGSTGLLSSEEQADKDLIKQLNAVIKDALHHLLQPYFLAPQTAAEKAVEDWREAEGGGTAAGGGSAAAGALSSKGGKDKNKMLPPTEKTDFDLICPPGVDAQVFADVLKLRQLRLNTEKALAQLQQQIATSRGIVVARREEGVSRSALRKAEKQLIALQRQSRDLIRQREEREMIRKRAESVAESTSKKKKK